MENIKLSPKIGNEYFAQYYRDNRDHINERKRELWKIKANLHKQKKADEMIILLNSNMWTFSKAQLTSHNIYFDEVTKIYAKKEAIHEALE